ncbi:hypothetical protein [Streptomyces sp. H39-S7]|uniref:hypothetical protein n=1 Tax=Streptomyces sp. H39-S7 TaxID=3004357 RepID=UPI0022B04627|nr:hypothetical protein [Streptomyces sp. H39-S7]MCZ4125071.1 hypothetical protein [Streptomyces sp. H39-S7]
MPNPSSCDAVALRALAGRQRNLATLRQLATVGVSGATASKRTRDGGPWQRILPHVYLLQTGAADPHQRLLAAVLYASARGDENRRPPTALLTGRAALALHGIRAAVPEMGARDGSVSVLVENTRRIAGASYVRIVRTRRWPGGTYVEGIPSVRAPRAAADAAAYWTGTATGLRALLASVVQRGFCRPDDLLEELTAGHRSRSPELTGVAEELLAGVRSVAEGQARAAVRAAGIPDPLWNRDLLTDSGRFIARPDAYWPEAGVALEIDSKECHFQEADWQRTVERRLRMERHGVRVCSVSPKSVRTNPALFTGALVAVLADGFRAGPPAGVRVR